MSAHGLPEHDSLGFSQHLLCTPQDRRYIPFHMNYMIHTHSCSVISTDIWTEPVPGPSNPIPSEAVSVHTSLADEEVRSAAERRNATGSTSWPQWQDEEPPLRSSTNASPVPGGAIHEHTKKTSLRLPCFGQHEDRERCVPNRLRKRRSGSRTTSLPRRWAQGRLRRVSISGSMLTSSEHPAVRSLLQRWNDGEAVSPLQRSRTSSLSSFGTVSAEEEVAAEEDVVDTDGVEMEPVHRGWRVLPQYRRQRRSSGSISSRPSYRTRGHGPLRVTNFTAADISSDNGDEEKLEQQQQQQRECGFPTVVTTCFDYIEAQQRGDREVIFLPPRRNYYLTQRRLARNRHWDTWKSKMDAVREAAISPVVEASVESSSCSSSCSSSEVIAVAQVQRFSKAAFSREKREELRLRLLMRQTENMLSRARQSADLMEPHFAANKLFAEHERGCADADLVDQADAAPDLESHETNTSDIWIEEARRLEAQEHAVDISPWTPSFAHCIHQERMPRFVTLPVRSPRRSPCEVGPSKTTSRPSFPGAVRTRGQTAGCDFVDAGLGSWCRSVAEPASAYVDGESTEETRGERFRGSRRKETRGLIDGMTRMNSQDPVRRQQVGS